MDITHSKKGGYAAVTGGRGEILEAIYKFGEQYLITITSDGAGFTAFFRGIPPNNGGEDS